MNSIADSWIFGKWRSIHRWSPLCLPGMPLSRSLGIWRHWSSRWWQLGPQSTRKSIVPEWTGYTPTVYHSTWKMVLGRVLSFWDGRFSGAMLNFAGVVSITQHKSSNCQQNSYSKWCDLEKEIVTFRHIDHFQPVSVAESQVSEDGSPTWEPIYFNRHSQLKQTNMAFQPILMRFECSLKLVEWSTTSNFGYIHHDIYIYILCEIVVLISLVWGLVSLGNSQGSLRLSGAKEETISIEWGE